MRRDLAIVLETRLSGVILGLYIGIMEEKMETTIRGLGFRGLRV